jgi:hypothetical protein
MVPYQSSSPQPIARCQGEEVICFRDTAGAAGSYGNKRLARGQMQSM